MFSIERLMVRIKLWLICTRNRLLKQPIVGASPLVVSMTTYGPRVALVHLAIEAIAAGTTKPARFILWLSDDYSTKKLPIELIELQKRGLEIIECENYRPHTKYYPYVRSLASHESPMVTADDDIFYPKRWLEGLERSHRSDPSSIHGYRVKRIGITPKGIDPYDAWRFADDDRLSVLNFPTGCSGVVYPPSMLDALREAGTDFQHCCPTADDVWLHAIALRSKHVSRQIGSASVHFAVTPGTQVVSLESSNVGNHQNDIQIAQTYTPADLARLLQATNDEKTPSQV